MNRIMAFTAATLLGASANAADLMDVYQRALQNDPQLREAEATKLAAMEAKPQAIANLLPQLSGTAAVSKQRDSGPSERVQRILNSPDPLVFGSNGKSRTNTDQYSLDLRQSVFRWENWVELRAASAQVAQAEADYETAQQNLITRVADAYFNVLAAQDTLESQEAAKAAIKRQLDQANTRFEVGLIAALAASCDSSVSCAARTLK
jgi:outer membrane protein